MLFPSLFPGADIVDDVVGHLGRMDGAANIAPAGKELGKDAFRKRVTENAKDKASK